VSGSWLVFASSHFSRATSTPPVFKDLEVALSIRLCRLLGYDVTDPASDPPTQAIVAGENAGDFPALFAALSEVDGAGDGLFKMAK
jgi:hypothetical protein